MTSREQAAGFLMLMGLVCAVLYLLNYFKRGDHVGTGSSGSIVLFVVGMALMAGAWVIRAGREE